MKPLLFIELLSILQFLGVEAACTDGKTICQWIPWEAWGSCSRTCGGGTRYRKRPLCCKSELDFDACLKDCRLQSSESEEYGDCNTICYNNGSYYGSTCHCVPEYGGYCCLDAKCSYKDHWCWPGYCYNGLAEYCHCDQGFERDGSTSYSKCKLIPSNSPDVLTCHAVILGAVGLAQNSTSGIPNTCTNEKFTYFNFQPTKIHFTMESEFKVSIFRSKPDHIKDYNFGVVQNSVALRRMTVTGQLVDIASPVLLNMTPNCTRSFSDTYPAESIVSCGSEVSIPAVRNGERVCLQFTSYGGGFLTTKDFHNAISTKQVYRRTQSSHEVCLRYDDSPPVHCSINSSCLLEPLNVNRRITTEYSVEIRFSGWLDPSPALLYPDQASGVEKYSLTLLAVLELDRQTLVMKDTLYSAMIPSHRTIYSLNLPKEPFLYALLLKVHDLASNVREVRRFVLYDNSSSVQIDHSHILRVTSASDKTNYTWQVNHGIICLEWKGRYYNSYHKENNLLRPIQAHASISLEYDQLYGPLSILGTPNVDGIVEFKYQWKFKESVYPPTAEKVANVTYQSFCESLKLSDGETYTFMIMPIDINNRSITETITVHIDSSKPEIDNISLFRNGNQQLYVHSSSDLPKMVLKFGAMDIHSGLKSIEWKIGTSADSDNIGSGTISVNISPNETLCSTQYCYCPMVGMCENYIYTATLNTLDTNEKGQNNTNYFLSIIVTNNACLICVRSIVILTDETPPIAGIIQDGPLSEPDIDFTGDDDVFVHWDGFIDHESGIKLYKVAVARRCLQQGEFDDKNMLDTSVLVGIKEVLENNASFTVKCPGRYFSSIVAYNNALQPSDVVCSDGFTRNNSESNMAAVNGSLRYTDCPHDSDMGNRSDKQSIGLIVGIVVGVTFVLILGVTVAIFVRKRRNFRDKLYDDVQRENQQEIHYSAIKDAIDAIKIRSSKAATQSVPRGKFLQSYNSLMMVDVKSGKTRLLLQFEEYIARMAKKPVPRAYENISLDSDYSGVIIRIDSVIRYRIDGKGRLCLITSISMTTSEFWKYIIDNNIGSIISLREPQDKDVDVIEFINIHLADYRVEEKTEKMIPGIQYVELQITHSENFQRKRYVHHVILQVGNEEELTTDVKNLVAIYTHSVRSIYGSENQNILIHTSQPNSDSCGIICCLFSILQHMDETDKFDVDSSLKHIEHTSGFKLDTFEKYKFIYDAGSQYIKSY